MKQIKLFYGEEIAKLEQHVNDWIKDIHQESVSGFRMHLAADSQGTTIMVEYMNRH